MSRRTVPAESRQGEGELVQYGSRDKGEHWLCGYCVGYLYRIVRCKHMTYVTF
jgi:hypothetical protein